MARKEINVGTSPNKGDGDPLRTAFGKINDNFAELYTGNFAEPDAITSTLAPDTDGTYDLGKSDKRWTDLYVKDFIYLNGSRIELTSNGTLLINGGPPAERQDTVGSVFADDSTVMVDGIAGKVVGPVDTTTVDASIVTATNLNGLLTGNVVGNVTGDLKGSVYADDSTTIIDGVAGSINLDGTVKGNIIPDADEAYDIGSMTHKFRDLYLSGSTINLGGLEITNDNGTITFGGEKVVVEGGTGDVKGSVFADDSSIMVDAVSNKLNASEIDIIGNGNAFQVYDGGFNWVTTGNMNIVVGGIAGINSTGNVTINSSSGTVFVTNAEVTGDLTGNVNGNVTGNVTGDVQGSVFGDDSTLLVDAVAGKIVGDIETDSLTVGGTGFVNLNNDAQGDTFYGGATTDKAILFLKGADYLAGSDNGGGVTIQGGSARNSGDNGDVIISSGNGGLSGTGSVAIIADNTVSLIGTQISVAGEFTNTLNADIAGSVFGDDSTLLVDSVNGKVVGDIETASLRTSEDKIALGSGAGETGQGISATAVGYQAGQLNQGIGAVALGDRAGNESQTLGAIAIGNLAGVRDQALRAVAIGSTAGNDNQGQYSVALGYGAGALNQGQYSVAIGYQAGAANQNQYSVVISGGAEGVNATEEGFYINPVRNVSNTNAGGNFIFYDTTSKEITYSAIDWAGVVATQLQANGLPTLPTQTLDISGSVFADDSTPLVDGVNGLITGRVTGPTYDPTNTVLLADPEDGDSYYNIKSRDGNTTLVDAVNGSIPLQVIDKFVNRSTFTSDFTIPAGSATLLQFDAYQGSQAFDAVTYQWTPANTGLYRLDFVLGLTVSEIDQPLIVFLYNVTDNENQIQLYNGNFTGSILSMSGTTYLTAGKNYQFGIIQDISGDAIVLDKDLTNVGIEELTRV